VGRPSLPVTGNKVLVPLAIALAALALGGIMTVLGRRRVTDA
jgi:LPXTG-motif cell wall-anchored protein